MEARGEITLRGVHPYQEGRDVDGYRDFLGVGAESSVDVVSEHNGSLLETDCPQVDAVKTLKPTQTVVP